MRPSWHRPQRKGHHRWQTPTAVWGWSALETKKPGMLTAAAVLVLLISISRLVLGVHFLSDVLLGLFLGVVLLAAFSKLWQPVERWLKKQNLRNQILLAFFSSLFIIGISAIVVALSANWQMPADLSLIHISEPTSPY